VFAFSVSKVELIATAPPKFPVATPVIVTFRRDVIDARLCESRNVDKSASHARQVFVQHQERAAVQFRAAAADLHGDIVLREKTLLESVLIRGTNKRSDKRRRHAIANALHVCRAKRGDLITNSPACRAEKPHADASHVFLLVSVPRTVKLVFVLGVNVVSVAPGLVANPATSSIARPISYSPLPSVALAAKI